MNRKIRLMALDIDGVITDGKVTVDSSGNEYKTFDFKDIDALFYLHGKNVEIAFITGESGGIAELFRQRFKAGHFYQGCHAKAEALTDLLNKTGIPAEECCYVGDARCDVGALQLAGYSAAPANAVEEAREAAKIKLEKRGGDGCIWELFRKLEDAGVI